MNYPQNNKDQLDVFRSEKVTASSLSFFSAFVESKAKVTELPKLKAVLQAFIKKENFLADYLHHTKNAQTAEHLTDFMRTYVNALTCRLEDSDGFLLVECFFYGMVFLAEKCRLAEHIFMTVLADFVESFGFALADNLLEVCLGKGLRKMEERLRFLFLFYSDDAQLRKLLERREGWSSFTLLYLFLMNPDSPRVKYLRHELIHAPPDDDLRRQLHSKEDASKPRMLSANSLLLGLLEEEPRALPDSDKLKGAQSVAFLEKTFNELIKRTSSKEIVEALFGIYHGVAEVKKKFPEAIQFSFISRCIRELGAIVQGKSDRNPMASLNEIKVILAFFTNFLCDWPAEASSDTDLVTIAYSNLMDLIRADNGFMKYTGTTVCTNLLVKKIRRSLSDYNTAKEHSVRLMKICLKGLDAPPETSVFSFKPMGQFGTIFAALGRILDEQLTDDKKKIVRIQEYLRRVEEEFEASKSSTAEMNNEVWKFLKKLP